MEAAWKAVLVESDRRCDLHNRVKEDLQMKVNNQLKLWQRENYHKVINFVKNLLATINSTIIRLNESFVN